MIEYGLWMYMDVYIYIWMHCTWQYQSRKNRKLWHHVLLVNVYDNKTDELMMNSENHLIPK